MLNVDSLCDVSNIPGKVCSVQKFTNGYPYVQPVWFNRLLNVLHKDGKQSSGKLNPQGVGWYKMLSLGRHSGNLKSASNENGICGTGGEGGGDGNKTTGGGGGGAVHEQ